MQESKTERDERLNNQKMSGAAQDQRMNQAVKLRVQIADGQAVVVAVTQQGQPHPKGITAVIDHTIGPMDMSGSMVERVKDAAINHVRGQEHEFSVSEVGEQDVIAEGNESSHADTGSPDQVANSSSPVGSTKESQNPTDQNVAAG